MYYTAHSRQQTNLVRQTPSNEPKSTLRPEAFWSFYPSLRWVHCLHIDVGTTVMSRGHKAGWWQVPGVQTATHCIGTHLCLICPWYSGGQEPLSWTKTKAFIFSYLIHVHLCCGASNHFIIHKLDYTLPDAVCARRTFIRHDMVTMQSRLVTRKERCLFLFSDLLVITAMKRRSATIRKGSR